MALLAYNLSSAVAIACLLVLASPSSSAFTSPTKKVKSNKRLTTVSQQSLLNVPFVHSSRRRSPFTSIVMRMVEVEAEAEAEETDQMKDNGEEGAVEDSEATDTPEATDEPTHETESDDQVEAEASAEDATEEALEEENEEPTEDPELTALKDEIAILEKELKEKRVKASRTQDIADDYSENGYQRKCAAMENMRRMNMEASSSVKEAAKADVIKSFLPNLDYLNTIAAELTEDEFYKALGKDFESTLESMELLSFSVELGSIMDEKRCSIVSEEYNDENEKGTVLRVEKLGYEVSGQVILMADIVLSKGNEADEQEKERMEDESKDGQEADVEA